MIAGIATLILQRRIYERRRQRHLRDGTRARAGLSESDLRSRHERRRERHHQRELERAKDA